MISSVRRLVGVPQRSVRSQPRPKRPDLQAAQRLLQRLLERPADRHRLADRLHLRRQRRVGLGELLERRSAAPW